MILGINIRYRLRFIAPIHYLVLDLLIFSILVSTLPFLLSTVLLCGYLKKINTLKVIFPLSLSIAPIFKITQSS